MCWNQVRTLAVDLHAPRGARMFFSAAMVEQLGSGEAINTLIGDAQVVVSEIVSNAVKAGCTKLLMQITIHRRRVRISVYDNADGLPIMVAPDPAAERGRGMTIVNALANSWGIETGHDGKEVWAEFRLSSRTGRILARCDQPTSV